MNVQNASRQQLLRDLEFMREHKWVNTKIIEYYDVYEFSVPKEEAQNTAHGCLEIIAKIVFEIVRRNYQQV